MTYDINSPFRNEAIQELFEMLGQHRYLNSSQSASWFVFREQLTVPLLHL